MYHAGVNRGLLDVSGDAGDESISVLKVSVEVGLWEDVNLRLANTTRVQVSGMENNSTCINPVKPFGLKSPT